MALLLVVIGWLALLHLLVALSRVALTLALLVMLGWIFPSFSSSCWAASSSSLSSFEGVVGESPFSSSSRGGCYGSLLLLLRWLVMWLPWLVVVLVEVVAVLALALLWEAPLMVESSFRRSL
jgi:hypothetical protein